MKKLQKNESGFTIIEVVLVLAIAGLIFLVVFLALPQLQRSQRDNERRSAVGRVVAAGQSWASDNSGLPTDNPQNLVDEGYLEEGDFNYEWGGPDNTADPELLLYEDGINCADDTGARLFRVTADLEAGADYCQDA